MEALVVEIRSGGVPDKGSANRACFNHGAAGVEEAVSGFRELPAFGEALEDGGVDATEGGESHDSRNAEGIAARYMRQDKGGWRPLSSLSKAEFGFADRADALFDALGVGEFATAAGAAASDVAKLLHGLEGLHGSHQERCFNNILGLTKLPEAGLARMLQLAAQLSVERNPEAFATSFEHDLASIALEAQHGTFQAITHSSLESSRETIKGQAVVVLLGLWLGLAFQLGLVLSGQEQQPSFLFGAQASLRTLLEEAVDEFIALQAMVAQEISSFGLRSECRLEADGLTVLTSDGEHGCGSEWHGRLQPCQEAYHKSGAMLRQCPTSHVFHIEQGATVAGSS